MSKDFLKLPEPSSVKRGTKPKLPVCDDCKTTLYVKRGWGRCRDCHRGVALPIGHVITKGRHKGKEVYLKKYIFNEIAQDSTIDESKDDLLDELEEKGYFIISEIEES
jgi:hypothetical protein